MSSYLLYEPNHALCTFIAAPKLQLGTKSSKMSIFHAICQKSDLISKLNPTRQRDSRVILCFQNKALDIKLLKFLANRDNSAYLAKHDF